MLVGEFVVFYKNICFVYKTRKKLITNKTKSMLIRNSAKVISRNKFCLPTTQSCFFSTNTVHGERTYGGLKDADRIFTNLYNDYDWHLKGAESRVRGKTFVIL